MNIFLSEYINKNGKNAGSKARIDVENILIHTGFKHIVLYNNGSTLKIGAETLIAFVRAFFNVKRFDVVIVEHPYIPHLYVKILSTYCWLLRRIKKVKTVIIIHDLNSIRYQKITICDEIQQLNKYTYIVCHNNKMKDLLIENGCRSNIYILGLFDYLLPEIPQAKQLLFPTADIALAGNLCREKCGYIYKLSPNYPLEINLYGVGIDKSTIPECTKYKGSFDPVELAKTIEGKYGLVWDGDSLECCSGIVGAYLKYNNPHKLSLYIASGIPVIVWKQSAAAEYVLGKHIGVAVESLASLPQIIESVSKEEYMVMKQNIEKIRMDIVNGEHLKTIVDLIKAGKT